MSENVNWKRVWAETVDYVVPLLKLKAPQVALYYYLLRHSRLRGQRTVTTTKRAIGDGVQRCFLSVKNQLRMLVQKRCIAVKERAQRGVTLEVFLPREIVTELKDGAFAKVDLHEGGAANYDAAKRLAIFRRDKGRCFYCRQPLRRATLTLDHLEPLSGGGSTRMENLVSCCDQCNRDKSTGNALRFLYTLYRGGRLTQKRYKERVRALRKLQLAAADAMFT
ncbi:MAG: HNH endonuclease [Acidobacteria bacterium]|nr:HNH endonuclease [Acidobacteriota bacterium]MCL5287552.1 HNH endonuclease [Acidobacteriota bacterium]